MIVFYSLCLRSLAIIELLSFRRTTFSALHSLRGGRPRNRLVAFAYALSFGSWYELDYDSITPYVYNSHLPDNIYLFVLNCNNFWWHVYALNLELEAL